MVTHLSSFLKKPIAKSATILTTGSLSAQIVTIVNAVVLARHLAPESYGIFVASYSVAVLTSFIFNLGMDSWLLRHGAVVHDTPRWVARIFILKGILGLVWGAVLLLSLPLKPDVFPMPLLLASVLDTWCEGFFNTQLSALKSLNRMAWTTGLLLLCRIGRLVSAIALIALGVDSPASFAQARLLITFSTLLFSFIAISPQFTRAFGLWRIIRESIPFSLSDLLAAIYLQADVTLLSLLLGNGRSVGLYATALSLVNALFVIPSSGYAVMMPALTRYHLEEKEDFRGKVTKILLGFMVSGMVLGLALGISGRYVTALVLGESYQITGELLMIFSPILFLKSISFGAAAFLVAVEWQRNRVVVQLASACTNIILNLLIIPRLGIWGAATVYLTSELVLAIGYVTLTARWFRSQDNAD